MKQILVKILILGLWISMAFSEGFRPKVGLVLSGGGARGFAHIGTLRMIDSLKIPIDYIAGTSMGGIVGALYAIGYDAIEIEQIIRSTQWEKMFTDDPPRDMVSYIEKFDDGLYQLQLGMKRNLPSTPSGLIRGQHISLMLSRMTFAFEHVADFDSLPTPYRCMAVDLITGKQVILKSGSLSKALRSTMSIPSLFFPVTWGDSLLIDGGLLNNLPIDVAKDMGSDLVIAVNVGRPKKTRDELDNLLAILEQSITIPEYIKEEENVKLADVMIKPSVKDLSPAEFTKENVNEIIKRGHQAAHEQLPQLIALLDSIGLGTNEADFKSKLEPSRVNGVVIAGNTTLPFQHVYRILGINPGDSLTHIQFLDKVRELKASGEYRKVDYDVTTLDNSDIQIEIRVKEKKPPVIYGFRIYGNKSLAFDYIYNLMSIRPGDKFDIDLLESKITELYSLGYFETINYDVVPVNENQVTLNLRLVEKPHQLMSLGFHYNNFHHLVGHLRYINANTFIQGLRLQAYLDFAGLTRLQVKALYPSGSKGFLFYPFILGESMKEPVPIHDNSKAIALYNNKYYKFKFGLGFWPNKSTQIETGLESVKKDILPEIGMPGLPEWRQSVNRVVTTLNVDLLDNTLIPSRGWKLDTGFEWSSDQIKSDIEYSQYHILFETYMPLNQRDNISVNAYFGDSQGVESTHHLWFYTGGSKTFVGIDYLMLGWYRVANFRINYRHQLNRQTYVKAIYNFAPNFTWFDGEYFYPSSFTTIQGAGIGLLYDSTIGPIELIYSRGDNDFSGQQKFNDSFLYLTVGADF